MSRPSDASAQRPGPAAPQAPAQLYALRLRPATPQPGAGGADNLQGEVEHVLSGARFAFRGTAALVAWLQGHLGTADPARAPADQAAGPAPRDATM